MNFERIRFWGIFVAAVTLFWLVIFALTAKTGATPSSMWTEFQDIQSHNEQVEIFPFNEKQQSANFGRGPLPIYSLGTDFVCLKVDSLVECYPLAGIARFEIWGVPANGNSNQ